VDDPVAVEELHGRAQVHAEIGDVGGRQALAPSRHEVIDGLAVDGLEYVIGIGLLLLGTYLIVR
jgi:hypothetical protein